MRILVVEDDRKVATFVGTALQQEGHAVDLLHEGSGAAEQACAVDAVDYDAVVLDIMLPGQSGFQTLRDIRARKASMPVLLLTAKDSIDERVTGLDSGADDYMVKPFALAELSARLRALLRRGRPHETTLRVADLEMDTLRRVDLHSLAPIVVGSHERLTEFNLRFRFFSGGSGRMDHVRRTGD